MTEHFWDKNPHLRLVAENEKQKHRDSTTGNADLDQALDDFNQHYAVVNENGRAMVFQSVVDPLHNRRVLVRFKFEDLKKLYLNQKYSLEIQAKRSTKTITRSIADWWLASANRRQFLSGVIFDPTNSVPETFWNLWTGFSVKPEPGSWSLMHDHIRRVICCGEEHLLDYLLNFIARMFQHPNTPGEVAIVFRGRQGAGKGILLNYLASAWGQHGVHITNAKHLTGNFNVHLRDAVMLFADEAFFAGDKLGEGVLKGLVTEPTLPIEGKYMNLVEVDNFLHIFMSSNHDWVIPAAIDDRRFAVFDVADNRVDNRPYFAAIAAQMANGGLAALIYDMLNRDIASFDVRDIPQTEALKTQKELSLNSLERWWLAVLSRGFVWKSRHGTPWCDQWHEFHTTELLASSYAQWCDEHRIFDRKSREQLGRFLASLYQPSRRSIQHPVFEIQSIERRDLEGIPGQDGTWLKPPANLDDIALVQKTDQYGYAARELDEARDRFLEEYPITNPWKETC